MDLAESPASRFRERPPNADAILRPKRVAAYRVFLCSPCIGVTPTVNEEIERTPNPRDQAELVGWKDTFRVELLDVEPGVVEARTLLLRQHHTGERNCQNVAEDELGGLAILLTFDKTFRKRLDGRSTALRLRSPTEYLAELQVSRGRAPYWSPAPTNPLAYRRLVALVGEARVTQADRTRSNIDGGTSEG